MKKIHIALAVLATAVLSSCVQEKSFNGVTVGENEIAFVLQGAATRSAEVSPVTKGISYDLGRFGNRNLFIEETITDLNYAMPETRGVPVYTENVGSLDLYKKGLVVSFPNVADATFETMDAAQIEGSGWRFTHIYGDSPWPANKNEQVHVYLRMPASSDVTISSQTEGKTTFSYTSPTTAEAQQDIIFAHAYMSSKDHQDALPNGYPVHFYHALSAVKFAIGNELTERNKYGIKVTGVSFVGLKNTGTCVFNDGATDLAGKITWTASKTAADNTMTQAFTYEEGDSNDKYVVDLSSTNNPSNLPASFYEGGTSKNLNKTDASYTFWVIPQSFAADDGAILRINYEMNGVEEYMDVPLSIIAKKAWNAGELRTYTFKLDDVNMKIEDTVTPAGNQTNAYQGSVKSNPIVTNTGNKKAYVRAAIVGQWWDIRNPDEPAIVFGFRDEVNNLYLVESWYQDQFVNKEKEHGEFVGLAGYQDNTENTSGAPNWNGWTLCTDGYYYYNSIVDPEPANADPNATSKPWQTTPLFTSYTLKTPPRAIDPITLGQLPAGSLYFTLEIASQAISASDPSKMDGTNFADWKDAWKNASADKKAPVPVTAQ